MICQDPEEEAEAEDLAEDHAAADSAVEVEEDLAEDREVASVDRLAADSTVDLAVADFTEVPSLAEDSTVRADITTDMGTEADALVDSWAC